jgi:hypothetical protein
MSYLPYARAPSGSWLLSGGVSVMAHVGLLAVLFVNVDGLLTFPPSEDPPLEAETRIELLRQDTLTNLLTDLSDVDVQDIDPEGNLDDLLGETAVIADPLPAEALALDPEDAAGALDSLDVDDTIDSNDPAQDAAIVEAQDTPQNSAQAEIAQAEITQASDTIEAGTIEAQDITQDSAQAEIAQAEITQASDAIEAGTLEAQDTPQAADLSAISIKSAPADTPTLSGTIAPVLLSEPEQAPPSTQIATSAAQIGEFQQSDTIAPMQPVIGSTSQALSEASVGTLVASASDTISVSPASETPQVTVVTSQASDVTAADNRKPSGHCRTASSAIKSGRSGRGHSCCQYRTADVIPACSRPAQSDTGYRGRRRANAYRAGSGIPNRHLSNRYNTACCRADCYRAGRHQCHKQL